MQSLFRGALLASALTLSACGGGGSDSTSPGVPGGGSSGGKARVIVADIDSGINPYHDFYHAGGPLYGATRPSAVTEEVLAELGIDAAHRITLTRTGDFAADFAADKAIWDSIQVGELYWFVGTNIIATTFQPREETDALTGEVITHRPILPDNEDDTHGVGTSAAVLIANPEAIILFVEADALGSEATHSFAFLHPSVDIVSTSYGVSIPNTGFPLPEYSTFLHTFDGVVNEGKLHFSSGGNGPGLTPFRAGAGPWWSIGVSGIEEGTSEGRALLSGNFPDFVSDFTQDLPYCAECETGISEFVAGTSFSTPRAAGVASRVLLEARRALGHSGGIRVVDGKPVMVQGLGRTISNWELRRSLEQAAYIPALEEFDPTEAPFDLVGIPVNPIGPWLQVGWGDLTATTEKAVVPEALAVLGFGTPTRVKEMGFCEFQTFIIDGRRAYWDNVSPIGAQDPILLGGGAAGEYDEDPFVYCEGSLP